MISGVLYIYIPEEKAFEKNFISSRDGAEKGTKTRQG